MKKALTILGTMIFAGAFATAAYAQMTSTEVTNFNHYLDNHPEVGQRLAANPQLANDPQFLNKHPHLEKFLSNHPGVRQELHQNPGQFMNREGHYEWSHGGGPVGAAPGTAAGPVARFDNGYLDQHPDIARQLSGNPGLADNPEYLANHPGLDTYLAAHPNVRQELQSHPYRFMSSEKRDDVYDRQNTGAISTGAVHRFDNGYLDQHPEVSQQLASNPRLVDNPTYLATHPGLDQYMAAHPEVRGELQAHPDRFMNREARYANHEGEPHPLAHTDNYLDRHPDVAQQLKNNPRLVDDPAYMKNHPELHNFMQDHPVARQEWKSHPYKYMNHEEQYQKKHPNN